MKEMNLSVGELTLSSTEKRTISGHAYTSDSVWDYDGGKYRFAPNSVSRWRNHVPVYVEHDRNAACGYLSADSWEDPAWKVELKMARTTRGEEQLILAEDHVTGGLSMFITDLELSDPDDDGITTILSAKCREISLVTHPAVPTAVLTGVALSAQKAADNAKALRDEINEFQEKETAMTDSPQIPEAEAMDLSAPQGPSIQPVPLVTRSEEPAPYPHLTGGKPGKFSLFADLHAMSRGDGAATERVQKQLAMSLAVTTDSLRPTDPPVRSGLGYQTTPDLPNPLTGLVSTGSIVDDQPFYVPSYDPTDESTLSGPHTEGVEPALGDIGSFSRQQVTPHAVSGKVALTREATLSTTSPKMEALVWARMDVARRRAIEVALATMLDGLSLPSSQVKSISRATAVDAVIDVLAGMSYTTDASRYSRLILAQGTYGDLVNQKDSTGRRMLPVLGPTNADGTVNTSSTGFGSVNIGGVTGRPVAGTTNSYLIDPSVVWQWLGPVLRMDMDYEVAWVRLGHFQFQASAVTDKTGIIRLTRASS